MKAYLKQDIARKLGKKSFAAVQSWVDQGIIVPEVIRGGPGVTRVYSEKNLLEFGLVDRLISWKVPLTVIKEAFEIIRTEKDSESKAIPGFFTDPAWGQKKDLLLSVNLDGMKLYSLLVIEETTQALPYETCESPAMVTILLGRALREVKNKLG